MIRHWAELPEAPRELEEDAKRHFPYRYMSAPEHAAREGHRYWCFGFAEYRYKDAALNDWVHTLADILFTPEALENVRQEILTAEERLKVQKEMQEDF